MFKVCQICQEIKPLRDYYKCGRSPSGLENFCKLCKRAKNAASYKKNPGPTKASANLQRKPLYERINQIKEQNPCTDCERWFPGFQLHFDHVRDKSFTIGTAVANKMPIEAILKEIEKCEVVCANCHAARTHQRHLLNKGMEEKNQHCEPIFSNIWLQG